jgi:hypothetical protein
MLVAFFFVSNNGNLCGPGPLFFPCIADMAKQKTPFQLKHELEYGTPKVLSVSCTFSVVFGCKEKVGEKQKKDMLSVG